MEHTKIEKYKAYLIDWLREWFEDNGKDCNAVVGISGGKDSTVVAALCVEALGKDRVIGVLMPNGEQHDIADSYKVCRHLGIRHVEINIAGAYYNILKQFPREGIKETSEQTKINLSPRLRMSTLYAVSQSVNGRVVGTGNASEIFAGFYTRYGDGAYDVNPIAKLAMEEVVELGLALGLPEYLVKKAPSDGLTGKTDNDVFNERGYSYADIYEYITKGTTGNAETNARLRYANAAASFKTKLGDTPALYFNEIDLMEKCDCLTCTNSKGCITCIDGDQYTGGEQDV